MNQQLEEDFGWLWRHPLFSVYRFFGWGMTALGAPVGGALLSVFQPMVGREWALRIPLLVAGTLHLVIFLYALPRLNSARIAETEHAAT